MVGAPLSNVSGSIGENRIQYGAVYRCPYPKGSCNVINIDNRGKYVPVSSSDTCALILSSAYLALLHL